MSFARGALRKLGWWDAFSTPGPQRLLAVNALVDAMGTGLAGICVPFLVLRLPQTDGGDLALALSAAGVAELLATVPSGIVAGRYGVWPYTILSRVARAAVLGVVALSQSFTVFLLMSVLMGLFRAGGIGLNQSVTASVVGAEQRSATLGTNRALRNIGYLVSAALGAGVLALDSEAALRAAVTVNGLTFLASAFCYYRLRPATPPKAPDRLDLSVLRDVRYFALMPMASVFGSSLLVFEVALPLWVLGTPHVPSAVVGVVMAVNTLLVVLFQFRVSGRVDDVPRSLRALWLSAAAFTGTALLFIAAGRLGTVAAVTAILVAAVLLTAGEMFEGPAWWTISFELAPERSRDQYLAAFDLSSAILNIVGPLLLVAVVHAGTTGWLLFAAATLLAAAGSQALLRSHGAARPLVAGN
ncbi:MFS transporter [Streptomyces sp. NPDC056503]|uniref:MFS transporter n=1 Tax=Streptomyces sp. NPDC056503 TaxID=3345842 RepID=UPI0036B3DDA1